MSETEQKKYPAFGKVYVIPVIGTLQYTEGMKIIKANQLGDLTTADATKLLSIALVEEGTGEWTPEIGKSNEEKFVNFPMEGRINALRSFFDGQMILMRLTESVFKDFVQKKTE